MPRHIIWPWYINTSFALIFYLQKYIGEKVSPDERLPWVQHQIGNGFAGKFPPNWPSQLWLEKNLSYCKIAVSALRLKIVEISI